MNNSSGEGWRALSAARRGMGGREERPEGQLQVRSQLVIGGDYGGQGYGRDGGYMRSQLAIEGGLR